MATACGASGCMHGSWSCGSSRVPSSDTARTRGARPGGRRPHQQEDRGAARGTREDRRVSPGESHAKAVGRVGRGDDPSRRHARWQQHAAPAAACMVRGPVDPREYRARTPREREVLDLVVDGHTNKKIAALLGVREKTVECHRANLMRKLSVESVAEMIRLVVTLDGNSMRRQRLHAWFVVLWILASTASVLSGMLDDLVSDLPELLAGVVSSLGMA